MCVHNQIIVDLILYCYLMSSAIIHAHKLSEHAIFLRACNNESSEQKMPAEQDEIKLARHAYLL